MLPSALRETLEEVVTDTEVDGLLLPLAHCDALNERVAVGEAVLLSVPEKLPVKGAETDALEDHDASAESDARLDALPMDEALLVAHAERTALPLTELDALATADAVELAVGDADALAATDAVALEEERAVTVGELLALDAADALLDAEAQGKLERDAGAERVSVTLEEARALAVAHAVAQEDTLLLLLRREETVACGAVGLEV